MEVTFGRWLKQRRGELGLTQQELAGRVECSHTTIVKIESGERKPSGQIAMLLAGALGLPADEQQAFVEFARAGLSPSRLAQAAEANSAAPWRALHGQATHLPSPPTSFVGREEAIAAICATLRNPKTRLLTLTGPPGIGKTRLSLQAAEACVGDFADGVYFVALSAISDPGLVVSSIAQVLGISETKSLPLLAELKAYVGDKRLLLVLDNFEQVVQAAPDVAELIGAARWLKVLATSREALHLYGEQNYPVPPLTAPGNHYLYTSSAGLDRLMKYEAVRLFVERAQSVKPDFGLTAENAQYVAGICVSLDRLPLAIELAAARTRALSPLEILSRLEDRLELLTGGARDLPARQQALRKAIDWSHDLLDDAERRLFRRLAVFAGGCTLQAAKVVLGVPGPAEDPGIDVERGLESLLDKSLIRREEAHGTTRYSMLQTILAYAEEKLEESGESEELSRRHARYFMELAEEIEPQLVGAKQAEWLHRLEEEYDNMRAALRWARAAGERAGGVADVSGDIEVGLRTAAAIWRFWDVRGYLTEGRQQLARMLALSAPLTATSGSATRSRLSLRAKALGGVGNLAYGQGDHATARVLHEESLAIRRQTGDKKGIATSLSNLGNLAYKVKDYATARSLYEESLTMRREIGERQGVATSLGNLGLVAHGQGDYTLARSLHEESLAMRRELGHKWGIAAELGNLGLVVAAQGDYAAARSLHEESLAIRRELGDKHGMAVSLGSLGNIAFNLKDYATARALYIEALALRRGLGNKWGIAIGLVGLGAAAAGMAQAQTQGRREGLAHRAARLLGAAEALQEATGTTLEAEDSRIYEQGAAAARALLPEEEFRRTWAQGRATGMEQAIEYALEWAVDR